MSPPFFPTVEFGWTFFGTLVGILLACSWVDLKKMLIPKWLTLPTLGLGLAFNVIRGGLLGRESSLVWQLQPDGLFLGALDGALFAAAGFAVAFAVFFGIWILGICGGGDVKLCAAVGAWIGPGLIFRLLLVTILMVALFMVAQIAWAILFGNLKQMQGNTRPGKGSAGLALADKPQRRLLVFSPPLAVATALLLLWTFRGELQLLPVGAPPAQNVPHAMLNMETSVTKRSRKTQGLARTGSAAVELLLVLPLLLLLLMAMVQIGIMMAAQQQLQLASREAARVAALGGSAADVENAAKLVLGNGALSQATITSVLTDSNGKPLPSGSAVVVEVSLATKVAVPNFVGWSGVALAGDSLSGRTVFRKE